MSKQYKISLRTLNIPLASGGVRLNTHDSVISCDDGFALCCATLDFTNRFDSDHSEGKKLLVELKKRVQSEALHISETSLRRTGKLYIEDSLYVFTVVPVVEDSVL